MNKVITTQGNVQFQFPDGKIVNVHPNHIYTVFNEDTVSFILVGLPKTSGLSTMTSKAEDLELNGTVYSFAELPNAVSEAFAIAGAQARCEIVDELPETGYTNTIYLVPQPAPQTGFDEYVYILDQGWELIGDTSIEMNNYVLRAVFSGYTAATKVIIDNEISARTDADTAEQTAREAADNFISGAVDSVSSGLTQEVQRAQNAESGLSDAIDAEITAREAADGVISGAVDTVSSGLTQEAERAIAAEEALDNKIDAVSAATDAALANKQNTLIAGENIIISSTTSGDVISSEGGSITIDPTLDSGSTNAVANSAITNAINSKQDSSKLPTYIVSDVRFSNNNVGVVKVSKSSGGQFTNTNNVITINNQAIFNNSNLTNLSLIETSAITTSVTSASTDSEIPTAKAVYDAIPQGGGGKAIEAGRGISITTGETADTINCTLNLENGTNSQSGGIKLKSFVATNEVSGRDACAFGGSNKSNGINSFVTGFRNTGNTMTAFVSGTRNQTTNSYEALFGIWALSNGSRTGEPNGYSDATLFAVGNGDLNSQAKHNAFDIRQNGDIYVPNTDDTSTTNWYQKPMVRLQDTIAATAANTTALGGMKIVKLTESEYAALVTKDSNVLYVVIPDPTNP